MTSRHRLYTIIVLFIGLVFAAGALFTTARPPATPSAPTQPHHGNPPVKKNPTPSGPPTPYGQNAANYELTFFDEFNGNRLNTNIWNDREWYDPVFETVNYAVEKGSLKIWPAREPNGEFFKRVLNTDEKFYQKYGYFEMEAKLPGGKGVWPAFWLYNHDHDKDFRPEIDIMEAYPGGGRRSGWSDDRLRPTAYSVTVWRGEEGNKKGFKMLEDLGDLSQKFHKYAVKWEPDRQTFFFDGKEVYSVDIHMPDRMYILVDILYGSASGTPDETTPLGKENAFEIKYVRAWQFKHFLNDRQN